MDNCKKLIQYQMNLNFQLIIVVIIAVVIDF